jgi:hypothetical protein
MFQPQHVGGYAVNNTVYLYMHLLVVFLIMYHQCMVVNHLKMSVIYIFPGCSVKVPSEVILLNSIVLPYKELTRSFKNEIIL